MAATERGTAPDTFTIAGRELRSRLLLGTGGFRSLEAMAAAIEASGTELVTVALRRIDPGARGSIVDVLDAAGVQLLPNTAGCFTARDAVLTAKLAREAFETDWVKLEVIGDDRTLLPDAPGAARGGRGARRRRLHGPALHQRRPDPRPPARGRRLRRGDAARVADRLRHGAAEPLQPAAHPRARRRPGDPRRRRRHRLRRGARDGARLRRRAVRERGLARRGPGRRWRTRSGSASRAAASPTAPGASRGASTLRPRRPRTAPPTSAADLRVDPTTPAPV